MGRQSAGINPSPASLSAAGIDFALIGHQVSWERIVFLTNRMRREEGLDGLPLSSIRPMFRHIPPRPLFGIELMSATGETVRGVYIETFIAPDECDPAHLYPNIARVKEACAIAARLGAPITALGGLTSIVLETGASSLKQIGQHYFTTGNTLTAAFVANSIEDACRKSGRSLSEATLLVIGSTGDIGSACVRWFTHRVKKILLHARQPGPLRAQADALQSDGQPAIVAPGGKPISWSTDLKTLLPQASIVIAAASTTIDPAYGTLLPDDAIVCDAGYPANIGKTFTPRSPVFPGGLGVLPNDFTTDPAWFRPFYRLAGPRQVHGCLLEAVVLALEKKASAYSSGRGHITIAAMEDIFGLAARHGITPAMLFRPTETNPIYEHY
ncbi:MAG TPA: hypothetical protein VNU70_09405 [Puia sp.]|jgi:predicted amino acid dehydrogenase|nr:hypothetical protein [Puia sp.]